MAEKWNVAPVSRDTRNRIATTTRKKQPRARQRVGKCARGARPPWSAHAKASTGREKTTSCAGKIDRIAYSQELSGSPILVLRMPLDHRYDDFQQVGLLAALLLLLLLSRCLLLLDVLFKSLDHLFKFSFFCFKNFRHFP